LTRFNAREVIPLIVIPVLNWKELAVLAGKISAAASGLFVSGIIIPERPRFAGGYLKSEWIIRLSSRTKECAIGFGLRPRKPYIAYHDGRGPKASRGATQPPFGLSLAKILSGAKLFSIEAINRERIAVMWFGPPGDPERTGLAISLIPATPYALVIRPAPDAASGRWLIIARSNFCKSVQIEDRCEYMLVPDGARAPENPKIREELVESASGFTAGIEKALETEAFETRLSSARKTANDILKQTKERLRQTEATLSKADDGKDWQRWGDLLKASLHAPPPMQNGVRTLTDYETGGTVPVPCDPQLTAQEQSAKFYDLARRRMRRIEESGARARELSAAADRLEKILEASVTTLDWNALEKLETATGFSVRGVKCAVKTGKNTWTGRTYASADGLLIMIGRDKEENLELTFRHARGNDIWMHARGAPGSHAIIQLPAGKSAPLETLLDCAQLILHHSSLSDRGKVEVDYTFRKNVKRIRGTDQVSYTGNKTLLVEADPLRLKRLTLQNSSQPVRAPGPLS